MASDAASDLRRLLASRLSESDHELLTEDNLQILIEKQYTTAERLSSARREGLREPPALSSAFVDALLNTFQPGRPDEATALHKLTTLMQLYGSLYMDKFAYTEGKITRKDDPGATLFSQSVKSRYGALYKGKCWCLLTDFLLPSATVIGAHLFKWEWSEYVHELGFDSINDVRNGLPLWKPLEWAFDTSRLCFIFEPSSQQFIAKILDPSILTVKLVDVGARKMGSQWRSPSQEVQNLTFQDIDSCPLQFAPGNLLRPYKRVLNFQARAARAYAIKHKWQPPSWDFTDYLTEGMEVSEKLQYWYNSMG